MLSSARLALTCGLAGAVLASAAPAAGAQITEVGQTDSPGTPSCPVAPCLAVSRTTGYQAKVGVTRGLLTVPADGRIVAWTIALGRPGPKQTAFFNETLGGTSRAGITVLRPGQRLFARVAGRSPVQRLEPWFGSGVMFPLPRSLPVRKGNVIALTVPTWAPALAVGFGNDTSWRASRARGACQETGRQTAQMRVGQLSRYECLYRTARLTYSATLIPTPQRAAAEG